MTNTTRKRNSDEGDLPLPKRQRLDESDDSRGAPRRKGRQSAPLKSSRQGPPRGSSVSLRAPTALKIEDEDDNGDEDDDSEEEQDPLLHRIRSGIDYTRAQGRCLQSTRFCLLTTRSDSTPDPALLQLRRNATLICASDSHEVYELSVPRPDWVKEGMLPGIHDPQWWLDKTATEIKAGPHADEHDLKKAASRVKGSQTRKSKKTTLTVREKEVSWKLKEGMRRQEEGRSMCEDDVVTDEESKDDYDDEDGVDDDTVQQEIDGDSEEEDAPVTRRGGRGARRWMPVIDEESESE